MNKHLVPWLVAGAAAIASAALIAGSVALAAPAPSGGPDTSTSQDSPELIQPAPEHATLPQSGPAIDDTVGEPADTLDPTPNDDAPAGGALAIDGFSVSTTSVHCNLEAPHAAPQIISFTWSTSGASQVFFGVATLDAQAGPMFSDLPASGSSPTDFPAGYEEFQFPCGNTSLDYTLTIVDGSGGKVSRTVTVVNTGDHS